VNVFYADWSVWEIRIDLFLELIIFVVAWGV
jgi:hypothetical protein